MFKARDVMTRPVISISASATVDECIGLMLRHHISGLPVVGTDRALVGVITELDLMKLLNDPESNGEMTVHAFMTPDVVSAHEEDSLVEIAERFMSGPFRRLPVVEDGKLVGILARRDVLRHIWQMRIRAAYELELKQGGTPVSAPALFE